MSVLTTVFYDMVMKSPEESCLRDWRRELLKDVSGKILEIGAGTGASLSLYPDNTDLEISLAEPDKFMRILLEKNINVLKLKNISVMDSSAEKIQSPDDSFDYVFVSLVCCSFGDVTKALKEIKRVLKSTGKLIFLEHVAAEKGTKRRKWQDRLNPLWKPIAGNCNLNRDTEKSIREAGFEILEIKHESMRKAVSIVRPTIRGVASPV